MEDDHGNTEMEVTDQIEEDLEQFIETQMNEEQVHFKNFAFFLQVFFIMFCFVFQDAAIAHLFQIRAFDQYADPVVTKKPNYTLCVYDSALNPNYLRVKEKATCFLFFF